MSDESEIRTRLEDRARAIGAKDAAAALRYYSDDVVNFDLAPPLAQHGREATDPTELQAWFDTWEGPIALELDQLEVRATGVSPHDGQTDRWLAHRRMGAVHGLSPTARRHVDARARAPILPHADGRERDVGERSPGVSG